LRQTFSRKDERMPNPLTDREIAIEQAAAWLELKPVYLDTETTGMDERAEICDLAVIDFDGTVLFESLIRPAEPIPAETTAVHGITNEMVKDAPCIFRVLDRLDQALRGRTVLIYNEAFDTRMLEQSIGNHPCGIAPVPGEPKPIELWWRPKKGESLADFNARPDHWFCAMRAYAAFYGEWDTYRRSYRWQSLAAAARQCGITVPADIHRAKADAELTRQIVLFMASQNVKEVQAWQK
jgi:DNA polymerase III epsilon subunit-like protein